MYIKTSYAHIIIHLEVIFDPDQTRNIKSFFSALL